MTASPEPTLDPVDWESFRELAHEMVDNSIDFLAGLREKPAWQEVPQSARQAIAGELPMRGVGEREAYRVFVESILPYTNGNRHPRFVGWAQGNGTPLGMSSGAVRVAKSRVLRRLREEMGNVL